MARKKTYYTVIVKSKHIADSTTAIQLRTDSDPTEPFLKASTPRRRCSCSVLPKNMVYVKRKPVKKKKKKKDKRIERRKHK